MNFLSRLIPKNNDLGVKSLVTLSPGEFSIVRREDSPKGRRELIFKEAEVSLVSTTREYFPQIKIADLKKLDEIADSDPIEPPDALELDKEDENTFLVHSDLKLGYYLANGRVAIAWQDFESEGDRFEFLCSASVTKEALDRFDRLACEAQYGQKYGMLPPSGAPESVFEEFTFDYETNQPSTIKKEAVAEESAANVDEAREFSEGLIMIAAECDLCVYDSVKDVFVSPKALQGVKVVILDQLSFAYFLEVRNDENALMGSPVHDNLNPFVDASNSALIFNYEGDNGLLMSYLLKFKDQPTLYKFENTLAIAQYEARNRARWSEVPQDQQNYLMDAINGINIEGGEESEVSENEFDDAEDEEVDVETEDPNAEASERNTGLEVGRVNDRTFVIRGNKIGVFKNTDRNLKYSTTIDNLDIDPSRIMLHEQDRALVIQSQDSSSILYRMDLETGKIVEEWETGREIKDFNPISKFAQTTAETNLYGVASQSMFRIDPRINGGGVDSSAELAYKSKVGFTDIATTAAGYLVVGNNRGELRLYDELGKRARTLLPGLGEPFVGLDVSSDGKYVLATCERYLLLIETASANSDGFTKALGKEDRARPRKLTIAPENVVFMHQQTGKNVKFTTARFNSGVDSKEATIVTSTGPYLVIWNLNSVLRGDSQTYRIKKYTSEITSENFMFGTDQRVILTLQDDVNMVAKSALKSPNSIFKPKKSK